jgi:hypothetical protein
MGASVLEFIIVGGFIRVRPQVLAMEMLQKQSVLRTFVLMSKSGTGKPPKLHKDETDGWITIGFNGAEVPVNGAISDLLAPLRAKYKDKIEGSVTCLMKYPMMLGANFTTYDLST